MAHLLDLFALMRALRGVAVAAVLLSWMIGLRAVFFLSSPLWSTSFLVGVFVLVVGLHGLWGARAAMLSAGRGGNMFSRFLAFLGVAFRSSAWWARVVALISIGFGALAIGLAIAGQAASPSESDGRYYKTLGGVTTEIGKHEYQTLHAAVGRAMGGFCLAFGGMGLIFSYAYLDREDDDEGDARGEGFWD